jgi:hypothetical protein
MAKIDNPKIKIFDKKRKYTSDIIAIIFDPAYSTRFETLEQYLKYAKYEYSKEELKLLIRYVQKSIFKQVSQFCHLVYFVMQVTGNWDPAGEQQSKATFCRCLLQIPPENIITTENVNEFTKKVGQNLDDFGFGSMAIDTARNALSNFNFNMLGKTFKYDQVEDINKISRFVGTKWFLQGGRYGEYPEYILGEGTHEHVDTYDVYTLERELVRTPNAIVSMAALIGDREIFVRKVSLRAIYHQKWVATLNNKSFVKDIVKDNINRNISEAIKQKTLNLYNIKTKKDLETKKQEFITDMAETILCHEFGHGTVLQEILSLEASALIETTSIYKDNIFQALLELMADCGPKWKKLRGALLNIAIIAKKDVARATRMFYMYLSDTWFFDTEDEYMFLYSEVIMLVLLRYINDDQTINFERIIKDTNYNDKRTKKDKTSVIEKMTDLVTKAYKDILKLIKAGKFSLAGNQRNYAYVEKLTEILFKDSNVPTDKDSYKYHTSFWRCMNKYVYSLSDKNKEIQKYLDDQKKKTLKNFLIFSCGQKKAAEENYDTKKYILDRFKQLGLVISK